MMMDANKTTKSVTPYARRKARLARAEEVKLIGEALRKAGDASDMAEVERVDAELRTLLGGMDCFWVAWSYYVGKRRGQWD
jgi:hypothetical protein